MGLGVLQAKRLLRNLRESSRSDVEEDRRVAARLGKMVDDATEALENSGADGAKSARVRELMSAWGVPEQGDSSSDAAALEEEAKALARAVKSAKTGCCSNEEVALTASAGLALYGASLLECSFAEVPCRPERQVLGDVEVVLWRRPSLEAVDGVFRSRDKRAVDVFLAMMQLHGYNVAAHAASCTSDVSMTSGECASSEGLQGAEAKLIIVDFTVMPLREFRIEDECMKLSADAEASLNEISGRKDRAIAFLNDFGDSVPSAAQTLGGVVFKVREVTSEAQEDSASAAAQLQAGKSTLMHPASISAPSLFGDVLRISKGTWTIIDRGAREDVMPVWELVRKTWASDQRDSVADLLFQVWREKAINGVGSLTNRAVLLLQQAVLQREAVSPALGGGDSVVDAAVKQLVSGLVIGYGLGDGRELWGAWPDACRVLEAVVALARGLCALQSLASSEPVLVHALQQPEVVSLFSTVLNGSVHFKDRETAK